jgi:hypothetical protein
MKLSSRTKLAGEGLFPILIVLALILVGVWWYLESTKKATERDGIRYGHEVIDRLVVKHDRSLLGWDVKGQPPGDLDPQAKAEMPPSQRDYLIQRFAQLGVPQQPIKIDDNVSFDSGFFHAHGVFTATLNYPGQGATLQIATSQGDTKWLINNITLSMGTQPR